MSAGHSRSASMSGNTSSVVQNGSARSRGSSSSEPPHNDDSGKQETTVIVTTEKDGANNNNGQVRTEIYTPTESSKFAGEEDAGEKSNRSVLLFKIVAILALLYFFVCSLDVLSNSFRLIAGRAAGEVFQREKLLNNPVVGVMIGILVTVAVQSSSTSTSIVVSMVSSGLFTVKTAIPIVLGANIGTSVTNTIVALTHMSNREDFERAFAGSVLHDMFNLLAVSTLLVVEQMTSYLEVTTTALLKNLEESHAKGADVQVLSRITKPLTSLIVQIDKNVIIGWSLGDPKYENATLLKTWCNKTSSNVTTDPSGTKCQFLFNVFEISDLSAGVVLLVASLTVLCSCLICLVKVLSTLLKGKLAVAVQRGVNANVPYCGFLTGYFALGVGAIMTILVQSSSVFTSAMTPLIALGMISLERAYPLTLGSNLGTTTTAMLAALAAEGPNLHYSIQLALCHFLFNFTGIMLFYPIPFMRFPIGMARALGRVTAKYRWFAIFYLIFAFMILPFAVFVLSLIGSTALYFVLTVASVLGLAVFLLNMMQSYAPDRLPENYRTWNFLPLYLHSLEPYDRVVQKVLDVARQTCCGVCCAQASQEHTEIIKMKRSSSSTAGLDNLGFVRGDQIDELKKTGDAMIETAVQKTSAVNNNGVEQTNV